MTLTLILLLHARVAVLASSLKRGRHLALIAQLAMRTKTMMRLRSVWCAVRVGMLEREAGFVWNVCLVDMIMTQTPRVRV